MGKLMAFSLTLYMAVFVLSCEVFSPAAPAESDILDGPIKGLSSQQQKIFLAGDKAFGDEIFTPETGLGPVFVANSCGTCHPGDGKGHPATSLVRFGIQQVGGFNHLPELGGPQLQNRAIPGFIPETIPEIATGITTLTPPAVTGLGYLEAVLDEDLIDLSDPLDLDGDGVSGRPNYITPPEFFEPKTSNISFNGKYIARFGKKAAALNLLHQTVNAYLQDIGITTDFLINDIFNPATGIQTVDNIADPEIPASTVHNVVFYLRTLKAPIPRDQDHPEVIMGKQLFNDIGCNACHVDQLTTGPSDILPLSNQVIHPYTDLLLHDMGPGLDDGYTEGSATTAEWRTPPLWGIGLSGSAQGGELFLLHDGRASSFEEAIILHGGEAEQSKNNFLSLSKEDKSNLIRFLESL